ncbi:MAG: terminase family protein, partial [Prevotella sp.]|nr:terminase family protein [Prevotella sp.]
MAGINKIRPQKGYQMMALSSSADIVIGGGAAGVGKTFTLLLEPLRHKDVKGFGAVIFRRTYTQIKSEGGLWDASKKLYSSIYEAKSKEASYEWNFGNASKIKFSHLEYEKNIYDWQGSEIPMIGFDELTHFSKSMFFYLLSRNRSMCGVCPYVRCTCNPDPDSWVAEFISWWIDPNTGFPIPERQGFVRYFVRDGESYIWGDTKKEVAQKAKYYLDPLVEGSKGLAVYDNFIKSVTFIGGSIYDNVELLKVNPEYLGNLASQSEEDKSRLLYGNWKVILNDSDVYNYHAFRDMFTNTFVIAGEHRIVIDVAGEGSNYLIAGVFYGYRLEDMELYAKSTGKDVIDMIEKLKKIHKVRNSNILYDADGVGFFIGGERNGFIAGAVPFHNNGRQVDTGDNRFFANIKTQCYIYSGERAARGESYIAEQVANKMYDDKTTVKQRFMLERKAIKKMPKKDEEPTKLISKDEM